MRYGYFDNENREYVIERSDIPVSWTNYLGVRDLCTVISHNAGASGCGLRRPELPRLQAWQR